LSGRVNESGLTFAERCFNLRFSAVDDGAEDGPASYPHHKQDVFRRLATSVSVPRRLSSLSGMNTLVSWAEHLAQALLREPLPRRWAHVQGVAGRAGSLAAVLGADADLLEAATWLHDIGYAPGLAVTGLHVLDGARYLRDARHADTMLSRLAAHHSYAIVEAGKRGLAGVLGLELEPAPHVLSAVLTYCEMTTSPDGELGRSKGDSPRSITATAPGTWSAGQSSVPRR